MLQRILVLLSLTALLGGCKLAVIAVEGGEVLSLLSGTCSAGTVCIQDINSDDFSDTFTAVAEPGWYFAGWNSGDGFFCARVSGSSCILNNVGLGAYPALQEVIDSSSVFYLMPLFKPASAITDTVTVDGLEWAQVDLFLGLSWNEINAACPSGTCASGAVLNGYDMSGWMWATLTEVGGLFQATTPHPGGIALYSEIFIGDFQWADDFIDVVGFRETFTIPSLQVRAVSGYALGPNIDRKAHIQRFVFPEQYASADTRGGGTSVPGEERNGGWFYRTP